MPDFGESRPIASSPAAEPRDSGLARRLLGFLAGAYLSPLGARRAFEKQFKRDAIGHRLHTWCAVIALVGICTRTTVAEVAAAPLLLYSGVRVLNIWWCWVYAALSPVGLTMLMLAAWAWLSLAWTPDRTQGLDELLNSRWVLLPGLLWPVLDRRRLLIGALALGMLAANGSQVAHAIGVHWQIDALRFPLAPDRNSGWWQPVVGGTMLTAALGLHLPAALMGRGRERILGLAGTGVTLLGILATGTRGAYLASAALVGFVAVLALARHARRGRPRQAIAIAAGAALLLGTAGVLFGGQVARRFDAAWSDLNRAIEQKDFFTDTGGRLLMGWKGLEATAERPLGGIGVGGYKTWCHADLRQQGIDPADRNIQSHAHNAYIHLASSFGIPALLVALAAFGAALVGGLRGGIDRAGSVVPLDIGTYDAGPACALMGLALVGMFDPVVTNMQTCAVLCALMGLCVMPRAAGVREFTARGR